ncbi:Type II secretion system (T2SS), protein F [Halorubrum aquaticum]|uniref:Type II secretion system (T2SS), protein F n=1 Tax=Halorubrum aquaticum TaxID=387340 RepID=A0A1I3C818_9EURY|nr:type II secretion system F family protein [Halorubrum aquaticum]SFH70705.1 Type II secretion system (T2SS), protein F [Halorubrum aquaticum]
MSGGTGAPARGERGAESALGERGAEPAPGDARSAGVDRLVHALFARHADDRRHDVDRQRYRGADPSTGFETYLARTYALSWLACLAAALPAFLVASAVAPGTSTALADGLDARLPFAVPAVPPTAVAACLSAIVAVLVKRATVRAGGLYLRWLVSARRTRIERTLPGAVRYLDALSSGSDDARTLVAKVARNDAYGGAAVSFRKALNAARLTGSLDAGLRRVARDTPSRDLLAPFLLKFRQHVAAGDEALAEFLRTESRLLAHRQEHARTRARRYLKPIAELFVLVLVLPALIVVAVTVTSVFAPGSSRLVDTPVGTVSPRGVAVYASVGFLLAVGLVGIAATGALRPVDSRTSYRRPDGFRDVLASAPSNPASASIVAAVPAAAVAAWLAYAGYPLVNVSLLAYVAFALPVGLVAARRGRIDDAKDRRVADFVHAVSAHASVGRPFPEAVATAASETDLGVLRDDVADLAFNLSLTTTGSGGAADAVDVDASAIDASAVAAPAAGSDVRAAALDRFVQRVGTPLAARTVGLVAGALNAGSTVDEVFETLQVEVDRLTHEKRALRGAMRRYVVVGWVAALSVAAAVAAINAGVMETDRLLALAAALDAPFDPELVHPELERFRLYVVAQATMLASGWFAGAAARGRYGALLHSGVLVAACYVGFVAIGQV